MSRVPSRSRCSASATAADVMPPVSPGSGGYAKAGGRQPSSPVAVGPRADVALGVERQAAEGARRTAGGDQRERATGEGTSRRPRKVHAEQVGAILVVVLGQLLAVVVDDLLRLDDELFDVDVPLQRHRPDAELLDDREVERPLVLQLGRRDGRDRSGAAGAAYDLVEELLDPLGQGCDLLLLQRDGRDPVAGPRLQVEGAGPGRADRPGDEAVGRVVLEQLAW